MINKVIGAPSASAEEFHDLVTPLWFTADQGGGGLALKFDFGAQYDLNTLHFCNHTSENFDVDDISFPFFNAGHAEVGTRSLSPALGSSPGIRAQDITLAAPLNVRDVTVFLSATAATVSSAGTGRA